MNSTDLQEEKLEGGRSNERILLLILCLPVALELLSMRI